MKIWIPGGSGMLAAHFKRLLTQKDIPYIANDSSDIDITQEVVVSDFVKKKKITHIINCAAYTQVDKAEIDKDLAFSVNAIGPENLGKAALEHGSKVIHFSTDYVFNGKSQTPYLEDHFCEPLGVYGSSKWEGERRLLQVNPQACTIRTSWLFGIPGKNFVDTMIRLMQERETLRVVSDQVGRPTYCQDLAEAALALIDQQGIFHFANSHQTSWYEFTKEIHRQAQAMGYAFKVQKIEPILTDEYPTPAKRPAFSTLSTEKISTILGANPRSWQESLNDYLELKINSTLSLKH